MYMSKVNGIRMYSGLRLGVDCCNPGSVVLGMHSWYSVAQLIHDNHDAEKVSHFH